MQNLILAIDTSCDDTSAAVVEGLVVHSNVIASQAELHKPYGGVFPTVAKQAHKENIDRVVELSLKRAGLDWGAIRAVAVTQGPGLAPALEVGIRTAKKLVRQHDKPLIAVNHIEGHALSPLAQRKQRKSEQTARPITRQTAQQISQQILSKVEFPVLSVIVSGKNTEFVLIKSIGEYEVLGSTVDDAAGECLDKVGRMVNLGYPAGPLIEQFAKKGDPKAFEFPLPMTHTNDYNLSFSGLKTAARNLHKAETANKPLSKQQVYDFCASIQYAVCRHITYKLSKILEDYQIGEVWLGGGVASNMYLRKVLRQTIREHGKNVKTRKLRVPYSKKLCVDNAAMIGVVAGFLLEKNEFIEAKALERKPRFGL